MADVLNTRLGVAAYSWWLDLRPIGWSQAEHLNNETVNCVGDVEKALARAVDVDIEHGEVHVDGNPEWREQAVSALAKMGYPEVGSVEGVKAAAARAKSFVSCAIGRIDNAVHDKAADGK